MSTTLTQKNEWAAWDGENQYAAIGYEYISAPNRYRKLFKGTETYAERDDGTEIIASGSQAMELMFANSDVLQEKVREMAMADWPEKADRFVAMEPHINLCDVILIWRVNNTNNT